MAQQAQPIKYEEGEPVGWETGLTKLKAEKVGPEIRISGPCPRCDPHDINYARKPQSGTAFAPNSPPERFVLDCSCKEGHPGAPPGKAGCGASGVVHVDGAVVRPSGATDEEMAANAWAVEAIKQRLPRIRAAAEKWGGTLSTLTGLFGAGTVLGADDAVGALTLGCRIVYGLLVAAALGISAWAITLAAGAAQESEINIPLDLAGRLDKNRDLYRNATENLKKSRTWALIAIVLLLLSFAVRWYGEKKPAPVACRHASDGSSLAAG